MKSVSIYRVFSFCIVFYGILFILGVVQFSKAHPTVIEKVVAVVEDEMISLSFLDAYKKLLTSQWIQSNMLLRVQSKKSLLKSRKKLLNHLIDQRVIVNAFPKGKDIKFNAPSGDEIINRLLREKNKTRADLLKDLKKIGMALENYKKWLVDNFLQNQLIQMEIGSTTQLSDQDINDHYLSKYGKPYFKMYKYEFNQWEFPLSQEGKLLAQKFSKSQNKDNLKGYLKSLSDKQMTTDLRAIIVRLRLGQFSKPLCLTVCYVFELLNKSYLATNIQEKEQLKVKLTLKKFNKRLKIWLESKRKTARIKVFL